MDKKKFAAALAAVTAYISSEEAMAAQAALQVQETEPEPAAPPQVDIQPVNMWGVTGRQSQMQANAMMLMRAFK